MAQKGEDTQPPELAWFGPETQALFQEKADAPAATNETDVVEPVGEQAVSISTEKANDTAKPESVNGDNMPFSEMADPESSPAAQVDHKGFLAGLFDWTKRNKIAAGGIAAAIAATGIFALDSGGAKRPESTRITTTTEIENPDGSTIRERTEHIIPAQPAPELTSTPEVQEAATECIDVKELPREHWEHSSYIENAIRQTILNNKPSAAESTTVYDRTFENLNGVFIDTIEMQEKTCIIRLNNAHIIRIPDESGEHEFLVAFAAWHAASNMMVYSIAGNADGLTYRYDQSGYELRSLQDSLGNEDPNTPSIGNVTPVNFGADSITVYNNTGWGARGQFEGLTPSDMPLISYAEIFTVREEALTGTAWGYSVVWDYDRIFRDKMAVEEFNK